MRSRWAFILLAVVGAALAALFVGRLSPGSSNASSHREAPLISEDPTADNTDLYAFRSPDKPNTLTIVSNWIPGEDPAAGPNYYTFSQKREVQHLHRPERRRKAGHHVQLPLQDADRPVLPGQHAADVDRRGGTTGGSRTARPRSTTSARASTGSSASRTTTAAAEKDDRHQARRLGSSPASVTTRSSPTSARSSTWSRSARRARRATRAVARTSCPATTSTRSRCRSRSGRSTHRATRSASGRRPTARTSP